MELLAQQLVDMEALKNIFCRLRKWEYSGLCLLLLIVLIAHFSIILQPNEPLFDEIHYVKDGRLIIDGQGTQRGEHPPLGKLFIVAGMQLFGDNPFGWRFFSVIFGAAGIGFMYLICRRLNLSKKVSYLATFLLAIENLSFTQGSIAMLDVFSLTFTLAAFWLYLKERYVMSGVAVALSTLAKLSGSLTILVIGLHWFLTKGGVEVYRQLRFQFWFLTGREYRRRFLLRFLWNGWLGAIFLSLAIWGALALFNLGGNFGLSIIGNDQGFIGILRILGLVYLGIILIAPRQWRFLLSMLAAPIAFLALMPLFDYIVWGEWLNPITQTKIMIDGTASITFSAYAADSIATRPWEWLLPYRHQSLVLPYWWTPRYLGMISSTVWITIIPIFAYMIYRAIKGVTSVLFPFSWFVGVYLIWIPLSLITDRASYIFYFYPAVGAICIGLGIFLFQLLDIAKARQGGKLRWSVALGIPLYLLLHVIAFIVLAPVSLWWSIPLGLLLYIFTLRFLGIVRWRGLGDSLTLPEHQVDMPLEQ